jgi:6-phosphogluconolactonase/glucosamine-6-phosphate isomerase/deaminase
MINGPVTPQLPASFLQLHRHVELICDTEAASALR